MITSAPRPYREALALTQAKTLLPTSLGSADLAALSPDIGERARFSAKVRSAEHLSILDDGTNDLVAGQVDPATVRLRLKQFLTRTGYQPPEGKAGGLEDFSSDQRINLQLTMNVQQAQGYGWWKQGQDPDILDASPCIQFLRVESREHPREDWPQRWNEARRATTMDGATDSASGVMGCVKNHPLLVVLSRFKTPYEPFDYGSGMGTEDRSRAWGMQHNIIGRDTMIFPQDRPFNADLQASPDIRSARLKTLLEASGVGRYDSNGVFVATNTGGTS